jgi:hypothetical protein
MAVKLSASRTDLPLPPGRYFWYSYLSDVRVPHLAKLPWKLNRLELQSLTGNYGISRSWYFVFGLYRVHAVNFLKILALEFCLGMGFIKKLPKSNQNRKNFSARALPFCVLGPVAGMFFIPGHRPVSTATDAHGTTQRQAALRGEVPHTVTARCYMAYSTRNINWMACPTCPIYCTRSGQWDLW